MKSLRYTARSVVFASAIGLLVSPIRVAAAEASIRGIAIPAVVDVALDGNQQLHGRLLNAAGAPQSEVSVKLLRAGRIIAEAIPDSEGRFAVHVEQGGTYQLATADRITTVRVWTDRSAPPHSPREIVVVQGPVNRGQQGKLPYSTISPWVIAGVVAVAIGVPVVLANHRGDRDEGS